MRENSRRGEAVTVRVTEKQDRATVEQALDPRTRLVRRSLRILRVASLGRILEGAAERSPASAARRSRFPWGCRCSCGAFPPSSHSLLGARRHRHHQMLLKMLNQGIFSEINGCISTGKEANVYHAHTAAGDDLAVKVRKSIRAPRFPRSKRPRLSPRFIPPLLFNPLRLRLVPTTSPPHPTPHHLPLLCRFTKPQSWFLRTETATSPATGASATATARATHARWSERGPRRRCETSRASLQPASPRRRRCCCATTSL